MPVNFQTDLRDLKDYGYVQQIPLEALFKNLGYKQSQYDQEFQKAKQVVDMVGNIPSIGHDTQKKQEIINQVNQELSKFANQDLREGNVQASLNGFIGQIINGKDLQGIAARATKYSQDQKTFQDLQKAGKSVPLWMQPSLQQANEYYSKGVYNPEVRFTGDIAIAPDLSTKHKQITDVLKPQKEWTKGKDGYWKETEGVGKDRLAAEFYKSYTTDPELVDYYDKLFEHTNSGTRWEDVKDKIYQTHAKNIQVATFKAALAGDLERVDELKSQQAELDAAYNSPAAINFFKQTAKDDFIKQQAFSDASAREWFSNPDIKVDEFAKLDKEQSKALSLAKANELLDRGIDPSTGKALTYTDSDGNVIEVGGVGVKQTGGSKSLGPKEQQYYAQAFSDEFDKLTNNDAASKVYQILPNAALNYGTFEVRSDGIYGIPADDGDEKTLEVPVLLITKDDFVKNRIKSLSGKDEQEYANYLKNQATKTAAAPTTKPVVKIARPK